MAESLDETNESLPTANLAEARQQWEMHWQEVATQELPTQLQELLTAEAELSAKLAEAGH